MYVQLATTHTPALNGTSELRMLPRRSAREAHTHTQRGTALCPFVVARQSRLRKDRYTLGCLWPFLRIGYTCRKAPWRFVACACCTTRRATMTGFFTSVFCFFITGFFICLFLYVCFSISLSLFLSISFWLSLIFFCNFLLVRLKAETLLVARNKA